MTAVDVGLPLAGLAAIVQVQHRGHRIHAQPVKVIVRQPEQGVAQQEAADLVAVVVKDQAAPVGVQAFARVLVLV